ncbi:MAG: hypothetical protein WCV85_02145 [Patescibacteria group bacterium]
MPMLPSFPSRLHARFTGSCPRCRSLFQPANVTVVAEDEEQQLLHLVCQQCRTGLLALVGITVNGLRSVEIVTDLTGADAERFIAAQPVNAEDVLALHTALGRSTFRLR